MATESEIPRVTEIKVRMDCNGCVQKIKKALHGINGIYDLYIDCSQQKLTIIGWADPETIVKAIRKTRKIATICSHSELVEPTAQPTEQAAESSHQATEVTKNPPPPELPMAEPVPTVEPSRPTEPLNDMPPPENLYTETQPVAPVNIVKPIQHPGQEYAGDAHLIYHHSGQTDTVKVHSIYHNSGQKDAEEVHSVYRRPPDYDHRYHYGNGGSGYSKGQSFPHEPIHQPISTTHSYNTYRPSPNVTEYEYLHSNEHCNRYTSSQGIPHEPHHPMSTTYSYNSHRPSPSFTEYEILQSNGQRNRYTSAQDFQQEHYQPPTSTTHSYSTYMPSTYVTEYDYLHSEPPHRHHSRPDHYNEDNHYTNGNGNGNITAMFSDENPNACRIM